MRKVISIALFGDPERKGTAGMSYHPFLAPYLLSHLNLFEPENGWELHVHVDDITLNSSYGRFLTRISSRVEAVKTLMMGSAGLTKAMLWRMRPVVSAKIDYSFCRDIDCVPMSAVSPMNAMKARIRFENGPASATNAMSRLG